MSRIMLTKNGKFIQVPNGAKKSYLDMGFVEVSEGEMKSIKKNDEQDRLKAYEELKRRKKQEQETDVDISDEWEEVIEQEKQEDANPIINHVKTTPITDLTLQEIRQYGAVVGCQKLVDAKRSTEARKLLARYLEEQEE